MSVMLADGLWAAALMRISLKRSQAERWDGSRLSFFLSGCCEGQWRSERRSGLQVSSEWGCPPVLSRLRGDLICLSLFYDRHLVEEGGLHRQQAGLFIMRYLLSLPDQSLMTPTRPLQKVRHTIFLPCVHQTTKNTKKEMNLSDGRLLLPPLACLELRGRRRFVISFRLRF